MLSGSPIESLQQSLGSSVGSIGQHKRTNTGPSLSGFSNYQQHQQQQQASISQSRQQAERLRQGERLVSTELNFVIFFRS